MSTCLVLLCMCGHMHAMCWQGPTRNAVCCRVCWMASCGGSREAVVKNKVKKKGGDVCQRLAG